MIIIRNGLYSIIGLCIETIKIISGDSGKSSVKIEERTFKHFTISLANKRSASHDEVKMKFFHFKKEKQKKISIELYVLLSKAYGQCLRHAIRFTIFFLPFWNRYDTPEHQSKYKILFSICNLFTFYPPVIDTHGAREIEEKHVAFLETDFYCL